MSAEAPDKTMESGGQTPAAFWRWNRAAVHFIGTLLATLLGLTLVTFLIARVVPIDPVLVMVGDRATPEAYQAAREALGVDKPIIVQYLNYLNQLIHGDLGMSIMTGHPVLSDTLRAFPATMELAVAATLIGALAGLPLGVTAAVHQGRLRDHIIRIVSLVGYSVPVFWIGLIGLLVFYARLGWVAGPGRIDIAYQYTIPSITGFVLIDTALAGDGAAFANALSHLILPAAILGYFSMAYIARMTRSLMIEQLSQDYILAARAKGVPARQVVWNHAFRNVGVPVLTVVSLSFMFLLEGAVLTETVFAWPGLGLYITQALFSADLNAVLGGTLIVGISFVIVNRFTDFLYHLLDPRTK